MLILYLKTQTETKVMNKWPILGPKHHILLVRRYSCKYLTHYHISFQFPVFMRHHFKFYNNDYDPFVNAIRLDVKVTLK